MSRLQTGMLGVRSNRSLSTRSSAALASLARASDGIGVRRPRRLPPAAPMPPCSSGPGQPHRQRDATGLARQPVRVTRRGAETSRPPRHRSRLLVSRATSAKRCSSPSNASATVGTRLGRGRPRAGGRRGSSKPWTASSARGHSRRRDDGHHASEAAVVSACSWSTTSPRSYDPRREPARPGLRGRRRRPAKWPWSWPPVITPTSSYSISGFPVIDGIDVIHGLRGWTEVPIIVLSARDAEAPRSKPSTPAPTTTSPSRSAWVSSSRACAPALRRGAPATEAAVVVTDDFTIDLAAKRVTNAAGEVRLTPTNGTSWRCSFGNAGSS